MVACGSHVCPPQSTTAEGSIPTLAQIAFTISALPGALCAGSLRKIEEDNQFLLIMNAIRARIGIECLILEKGATTHDCHTPLFPFVWVQQFLITGSFLTTGSF